MKAIVSYIKSRKPRKGKRELFENGEIRENLFTSPCVERSVFNDLKLIVYDMNYVSFEFNSGMTITIETKKVGNIVVGE